MQRAHRVVCTKKTRYCHPRGCLHGKIHRETSSCKSPCCTGSAKCIDIGKLDKGDIPTR